ncbi:beta-N-acetylhexosaminidase [Falsihalocynthiibacter arcticus]|uniref:beta-N-acetylhexosaminidase n=1 Tax=Falsihalocynthiibacter arcticus TaxID=1579316 RepID=A0A126V2H1_9RHOB|nr:beta-N-acetylhexosaminidase [Falsihalocynthiibacter arcticus]AML52521.1 beta-hexosaminidase [Falsihalocynthiibacter arcticus]
MSENTAIQTATSAVIFGCSGPELLRAESDFFARIKPFGFILFARNIESPEQLLKLTSDLRNSVGCDAPILIDQEGGRVARMREPHWREWLPALDEVAISSDPERSMYLRSRIMAQELLAVGIDANCAPVLDLVRPETHGVLANRCYGETPEMVVKIGRAVATGLRDGGVFPVAKHMPGHGRASVDSHKDLPRTDATTELLAAHDFAPFKALNDLPMAMSAHVVYEAYDTVPATTSQKMIRLIRKDIGFSGLLMSDDLSMEALSGTPATRAAACREAGIDVVLHCNGILSEMEAVAEAAGPLTDVAKIRAQNALATRRAPDDADISILEAEHRALLSGAGRV